MKGVSVLLMIGLTWSWGFAQFLNHRPFPTYSLENMPDTEFSCRDKILGGYYADPDTQCQMFHICVKVAGVGVQDFRFLCPNGTAFDQDHQICADWEDVDCDATTLYYSSDNFDLYRIGSGYESKAFKYGEDEETFALQRAETGDARINREHQAQRVNQQKEEQFKKNRPQKFSNRPTNYNNNNNNNNYQNENKNNNNNNNNNDRDIFKGSSSSNFFNNKNGGKETDEDYDDNVNVNQDRDQFQKRKIIRKQNRRPNENNNNYEAPSTTIAPTTKPHRPTGFVNNFAGSSYVPTTSRPTTTSIDDAQYSAAINNYRGRNRQRPNGRQNQNQNQNYNNDSPTPTYTVSTPAPFKQNQQYQANRQSNRNNYDDGKYRPSTPAPDITENYPSNFNQNKQASFAKNYNQQQKTTESYPTQSPIRYTTQYDIPKVKQTKQPEYSTTSPTKYNNQYDTTKVKQTSTQAPIKYNTQSQYDVTKVKQSKQTENYASTVQKQSYSQFTTFKQSENYPTTPSIINQSTTKVSHSYNVQYDIPKVKPNDNYQQQSKKQTTTVDNYPTTLAPKPYKQTVQFNNNNNNNYNKDQRSNDYPSTFSPKTNTGYTQISQQTTQYNKQKTTFNQQYESQRSQQQQYSTPRTTPVTQYTPTVPKISSTTPVTARSNRFDETHYDDGSYDSKKYERNEDEFLKTAHSQNIASSRNELSKTTKNVIPSTQKPYYESPRPFSVSSNTPKVDDIPKTTQHQQVTPNNPNVSKSNNNKNISNQSSKKVKDASYDYAYYDTNVGSEPEYEIDTDIKKSSVKN